MSYTEAQAQRAAYLEMLQDTADERDTEHLRNCIRESIRTDLTDKQRAYLLLYMSGSNCSEIAMQYDVSKSTVSRVLNSALDNLFRHVRYATPRTLKCTKELRNRLTIINRR